MLLRVTEPDPARTQPWSPYSPCQVAEPAADLHASICPQKRWTAPWGGAGSLRLLRQSERPADAPGTSGRLHRADSHSPLALPSPCRLAHLSPALRPLEMRTTPRHLGARWRRNCMRSAA